MSFILGSCRYCRYYKKVSAGLEWHIFPTRPLLTGSISLICISEKKKAKKMIYSLMPSLLVYIYTIFTVIKSFECSSIFRKNKIWSCASHVLNLQITHFLVVVPPRPAGHHREKFTQGKRCVMNNGYKKRH